MKKYFIHIAFIFGLFSCFSQVKDSTNLKVGLVLSGGGAKGLAHIGALKAIEEAGVHIDYIAGTSMGAIVGALYAAGYRADELKQIFESADFEKLIKDDYQRKNKSFLEREDDDRRAITLPFNHFKIDIPSALSKGQNSYNLYVKLLYAVKDISDFSKLPIPFFCMATDIETGKQVLLDKGYLPNAIAASSTIPSIFEPVYLNGKVLIDGGVTNNYPIDELLNKNVNYVIGVDVQDSLKTRKNLKSVSDVMLQVSNMNTHKQMESKRAKTNIYIKPNITNYTILSFDKSDEIFKEGYSAALQQLKKLKLLAAKQIQHPYKKIVNNIPSKIKINKIIVAGNENYTQAYILGKLKIKENTQISLQKIEDGVVALVATDNFHKVNYRITKENDLMVDVVENHNNTQLKLGLHYDNLYQGNVLLNVTQKQLLTNNDVCSLDVIVGKKVRYQLDYYLDKGFYWSIGVRSKMNAFEKSIENPIINNIQINETKRLDAFSLTNQFYFETILKKEFSLSLGVEHEKVNLEYGNILNTQTLEDNDFFSTLGTLIYDTLDDKYYPTKGVFFDGDVHMYLFTSKHSNDFVPLTIAQAKMGFAKTFFNKLHLNIFSEGGFRIGENSTNTYSFVLGGYGNNFMLNYKPFYGYDYLNIIGNGYVKGDIDVHYEFSKNQFFTASANFANVKDRLFDGLNWLSLPDYTGYALGYGVKTFAGPMQIKSTWSPEVKKVHWFISLGYWF